VNIIATDIESISFHSTFRFDHLSCSGKNSKKTSKTKEKWGVVWRRSCHST